MNLCTTCRNNNITLRYRCSNCHDNQLWEASTAYAIGKIEGCHDAVVKAAAIVRDSRRFRRIEIEAKILALLEAECSEG